MFLIGCGHHHALGPGTLTYTAAGLATGCGLGVAGLMLTRWEVVGGRLHYTPDRWLVLAITLIVTARVFYGFYRSYQAWQATLDRMAWVAASGRGRVDVGRGDRARLLPRLLGGRAAALTPGRSGAVHHCRSNTDCISRPLTPIPSSRCFTVSSLPVASTDQVRCSTRCVLENSCRRPARSHRDLTLIVPPGTSIAVFFPSTWKTESPRGSMNLIWVGRRLDRHLGRHLLNDCERLLCRHFGRRDAGHLRGGLRHVAAPRAALDAGCKRECRSATPGRRGRPV